ncbi:hypothetical protein N7468_007720 [Penicillium chermesinum]|uniref:Uncharacterized protein n=1 Tax=Penicillium chermesinum TaxID=63820 RepID=A0A9W9NUV6_9EURO|nr:uncharacterized protein N7468_007720 [Penicillium chermesinum]KAJ5226495.1 hypothetical protein N7468_007720 [Penicillium chermesinum]
MSTLNNVDSVANAKQGSFKPSIAPDAPQTTKGHKPGVKVNEADQRPEFHMETHPPGTAPASNSYTPNADETGSQANNPNVLGSQDKEATYTSAGDTLMGATSQDVHTGLGKPLQGQTNVELAHDGAHGRKKQTSGLEGVGASSGGRGIERQFPDQRALEKEEGAAAGTRGNKADRAAENMNPEPAETMDREWKYEPTTKRN